MTEYVCGGRIEHGRLKIRNKAEFEGAMGSFREGEVFIRIERAHATRSAAQNAYYWAVVIKMLHEYTEQDVLDLHEYCKKRFNPKVIVICDDKKHIVGEEVIGLTTTKLNKVTFGEYIERVRQWMLEDLGIITPDPDPNWREHEAA